MEDLQVKAGLVGDYDIELASSMNEQLESSEYIFAYVVHDGVYLCECDTEDPDWLRECEFTDRGSGLHAATDEVSQQLDDQIKFVDFPGMDLGRIVYTEVSDE